MNLKKIFFSIALITIGLFTINAIFKGEPKDALDKRIFLVNLTELKDGSPPKKSIPDEIEFRAGKGMFSNYLYEKMEFKWIKYEIKKDSTFVDETETEVNYVEAEITTTDDKDQTLTMNVTVEDYDIKGEIKITKKDKLKKRFEFSGKEKPKKK
jgi:hypothetical protein